MKEISLKFDRDFCCHSIGQCIDEIVQIILYVRGQIPSLVSEILKYEEIESNVDVSTVSPVKRRQQRKSCQFANHFRQLRSSLKEIFRSINRNKIFDASIVIGDAPFSPKDIYFINFKILSVDDDTSSKCCGLSEKEFKYLSRSIVCGGHFDEIKKTPMNNCYIFVNAKRDAELQKFGFLPRTDINLRRTAEIKNKLNVFSLTLSSTEIVENVNSNEPQLVTDMNKLDLDINSDQLDSIWFMFEHPLVGFSD